MKQVRWEGRLETVSRQPWIVLDGAHNRDSARCLREALMTCFQYRRLILVLGISANKNLEGIIEELAPIGDDDGGHTGDGATRGSAAASGRP